MLALLLPFVLLSCSERKGNAYNPALLALERALDKTPESTAAEVLRTDTLAMGEADKALYHFLLIKARALAPDAMPGPRDEPVLPLSMRETMPSSEPTTATAKLKSSPEATGGCSRPSKSAKRTSTVSR